MVDRIALRALDLFGGLIMIGAGPVFMCGVAAFFVGK